MVSAGWIIRVGALAAWMLVGTARAVAQLAPTDPPSNPESTAAEEIVPPGAPAAPAVAERTLEESVALSRGATCLDRERLIERVSRWLQRPTVEAPIRVHVRGDPERPTRVFFSVVREPGEAAERRLDNVPTDCDQLHSAVALSIALAIEATLRRESPDGDFDSGEHRPPGWPRREPARSMHLDLAVLGGAAVGVLTSASLAGTPRLALSPFRWLEIALVGLGTHVADETVDRVPGSFSATVLAGGLDACFGGETTYDAAFFMCVGGRAGVFRTRGLSFASNVDDTAWWAALAASGQGRFWLSGAFGVGTSVEAIYALRPRKLVVANLNDSTRQGREVPNLGLNVTIGPIFRIF